MKPLTRSLSKTLAVSLLVLVLVLIVAAVTWPVWLFHERYDTYLDTNTDRLARYRRVEALRPAIDQALVVAEKQDSRQYYLKAHTPPLAGAELQGIVTKIVETQNGHVFSSQIVPGKDDPKAEGPSKVAMSIQFSSSMVPLQMILHATESQEPYLFIDQVTIRGTQGRGYKPTPGVQPEFTVQLAVHAFMRAGGGKS